MPLFRQGTRGCTANVERTCRPVHGGGPRQHLVRCGLHPQDACLPSAIIEGRADWKYLDGECQGCDLHRQARQGEHFLLRLRVRNHLIPICAPHHAEKKSSGPTESRQASSDPSAAREAEAVLPAGLSAVS